MALLARAAVPLALLALAVASRADQPLHARIDALIAAKADGRPTAAPAADAEFLRRAYLDLAGRIPSVQEARDFLADPAPDKRAKVIDRLLDSPDYPRRMQELFHVMLMERLGDHPEWTRYLQKSFEANKPWDQMAREILNPITEDESLQGAAFFYTKRLENFGQNPVDYPGLTRDVGRLFLGKDLRCAECHDHIFIAEYKQEDFQGLFAIYRNTVLVDPKKPAVGEQLMTKKLEYSSVFRKVPKSTGPRIPGGKEIEIPVLKKGEEYVKPPDRKTRFPGIPRFSPLAELAKQLPTASNPAFSRNIVNRLWFILMGRGLVHPLDLHHAENPPSHPELLDLLAKEFVEHRFDIKWLLRELALSQTYQRSSVLPEGVKELPPESFLVANEKRLSAEQLLASMLEATGMRERVLGNKGTAEAARAKFVKAFANPEREPEEEFNPSLKAALFVLNDDLVLSWLTPQPGNLIDRLSKLEDSQVAEELYLSVLTRRPTVEEQAEVADYLHKNASRRAVALGHLAWALLASTEFCVNH
ncbi:MAG TPA: DUF1553 domain-containing protein [Gemmataceae bacterium]|nr:DUF1553 domain-containing protein [Gemmataceae bacterium]